MLINYASVVSNYAVKFTNLLQKKKKSFYYIVLFSSVFVTCFEIYVLQFDKLKYNLLKIISTSKTTRKRFEHLSTNIQYYTAVRY